MNLQGSQVHGGRGSLAFPSKGIGSMARAVEVGEAHLPSHFLQAVAGES